MNIQMANFFRYARNFCLIALVAALAFCLFTVYQILQTMNHYLIGAETYTCREFEYDMTQPETNRFGAMLIASFAYGINPAGEGDTKSREDDLRSKGMSFATQQVHQLCAGQPNQRVFNLLAHSITGKASTQVSTTLSVDANATISGTTVTSPTNTK